MRQAVSALLLATIAVVFPVSARSKEGIDLLKGWRHCQDGIAAWNKGDSAAAYSSLLQSAALKQDAFCIGLLGRAAFATQRYSRAIDALQRSLQLDESGRPNGMKSLYYTLGHAYAVIGRHEKAVLAFDRAARADFSDREAWAAYLAALYAVEGLDKASEASYVGEKAGHPDVHPLKAAKLEAAGWAAKADARNLTYGALLNHALLYRTIGALGPDADDKDCEKANRERVEHLLAVYRLVERAPLKLKPSSRAVALAKRARDLMEQDKWPDAFAHLIAAQELSPWWAEVHFDLAVSADAAAASSSEHEAEVYELQQAAFLTTDAALRERVKAELKRLRKSDAGPLKTIDWTQYTDVCAVRDWIWRLR